MTPSQMIYIMIAICVVFMAVILFAKPLKMLLKMSAQAAAGMAAAYILNFILSPLSLSIGINSLNALVVGILGLPGLLSLYIIQAML